MENNLDIAQKVTVEFGSKANQIMQLAEPVIGDLKFPNPIAFQEADKIYNSLHSVWSQGEKFRLSFTAPLNEVLGKINQSFKGVLDPLATMKRRMKAAIDNYATAEMLWKRSEEKRIAEEKRKADEKALAEASKLESQGRINEAEKTLDNAIAAVPLAPKGALDQSSVVSRTVFKVEIMDLREFLNGIADGKIPAEFITVNFSMIERIINQSKGKIGYPGLKATEMASVRASGR